MLTGGKDIEMCKFYKRFLELFFEEIEVFL